MSFDNTPVVFLEDSDFKDGILHHNGKPITSGYWFIMVQGSFCGHCKTAKPKFAEVAGKMSSNKIGKGLIFATIHTDSNNEPERNLSRVISSISGISIPGIPAFLLYNASTRKFTEYKGGREVDEFEQFLNQYTH